MVDDVGEDQDGAGVELAAAIEALRSALVRAWWDGQGRRVRFRVEPVELTVQVGVTRVGKGSAGIQWRVLSLGGERSREAANTQTLKLRLAPVLFDDEGQALAEAEQLVADRDDGAGSAAHDVPIREPE
jgi:hypothetical protein